MWHRGEAHRRTHLRDIRLHNNAGMDLPVCEAGRSILRTESTFTTTGELARVTCPRCLAQAAKRYPWAYTINREA
jgi:hypothetical protein